LSDIGVTVTVVGPQRLARLARQAAAHVRDEVGAGGGRSVHVVLVDADAGGPGKGPALVSSVLATGALAVIGVAPTRAAEVRASFFEAGAADVVGPRIGAAELGWRIARVVRTDDLELRVQERTRQADEQRALFQAVVDSIPVSLYAIDRQRRVVVWNRGREAGPFGRPRGEVLGQDLFDVVRDDEALRREFDEVFRTGEPRGTEVESRGVRPPRLYRVEKLPMRLGNGRTVTHVITFARDVTEQRALERSMAHAEKLAAIGRLAAGIAHEINNPLATIAGCAEAMRTLVGAPLSDEERGELAEDARVIEEEAYRCKEILESLLDFSRVSSERRAPCDLAGVAQRTVRLLRHNPKIARADLRLELDHELPRPAANEQLLVEALMALILNAADAAPGGRITISAGRRDGRHVTLAVADDGPGIPAELRERIFEPFFTTKPPGQGTGLGLSVVYGVLQAQGGQVDVCSSPGRGCRFELVLPVEPTLAEVTT
jgi:two-component system NtrC family sensor kinase